MMKWTILALLPSALFAQDYWQQQADYKMNIDFDHETHRFKGEQWITYTNHSPDTLKKVYYHLYFNAFQPESMMDTRSRNIPDPDGRVKDRILHLKPDEIGYHRIESLDQDGSALAYTIDQTLMKVALGKPLAPGQSTQLHLVFNSQVPVQIRRSGRNNKEGVDYSMAQWYPKLAEYDREGWHANPYVAREFYGVWGNWEVNITIDSKYVIGGTGVLQNPNEIGHGYTTEKVKHKKKSKITWKFKADNVHDFMWAADPEYIHDVITLKNGMPVHFFYLEESANVDNWKKLEEWVPAWFDFMNSHFGEYMWPQFSAIQGGDGGMEYPMSTLIVGGGKEFEGLAGLFAHEAAHNWFYGMLASNEQKYPWMDEGFTTFAEEEAMNFLFNKGEVNAHLGSLGNYYALRSKGWQEPMSTPADHFDRNAAYSISSYSMGDLFLVQLRYIIGDEVFQKSMLEFFDQWHGKHPTPADLIRIMEVNSDIELDWFITYWTQMTKPIDYAIQEVSKMGMEGTVVQLKREGTMPMPVDVYVKMKNGDLHRFTIPLVEMQGFKKDMSFEPKRAWPWTHPEYTLELPEVKLADIEFIELDPFRFTADINFKNNSWKAE